MTDEFQRHGDQLSRIAHLIAQSVKMIDEASAALVNLVAVYDAAAAIHDPVTRAQPHSGSPPEDEQYLLHQRAIEVFGARRLRVERFPPAMFGEPAWDMLLALYIRDWAGARLTINCLAQSVHVPLSTATRWLAYLDRERLIVREEHPTDRRKTYIAISPKGRDLLSRHLRDLGALVCRPGVQDAEPGL